MLITKEQSSHFDGWRGALSVTVLFAHTFQVYSSKFDPFIVGLTGAFAGAAVSAFFVLSGFFIHKSLERCSENGNINWPSYLISRADRILPPFLFALALTGLLYLLSPIFFISGSNSFTIPTDREGFYISGFFDSALFLDIFTRNTLSANGPLWSLTVEVWYYFMALLYVLMTLRKSVGYILLPLAALVAYYNPWFYIYGTMWIAGYFVSTLHSKSLLPKLIGAWYHVPPIVALLAIFILPPSLKTKAGVLFQFIFGAWFAVNMIKVLCSDNVGCYRVLEFAGKFSYTLYVVHFPILLFCYGIDMDSYVLSFYIAICFAALFGGIERVKPLRSLKSL